MNHKLFLLTIYAFSATFICKSMEDIHQYKELKTVAKPFFAQYITHDRAIIAGEDECCIINPMTDEVVKKIETNIVKYNSTIERCNMYCAIHPDKTKFALSCRNKKCGDYYELAIYDTKTGEKKWSIQKIRDLGKFIFSPINSTIFIDYSSRAKKIIECNYLTNPQHLKWKYLKRKEYHEIVSCIRVLYTAMILHCIQLKIMFV